MVTHLSVRAAHAPPSPEVRALEATPLTLLHVAIVALCACGFAIDLSELALGSILSVIFSTPPHRLSGMELSFLLSSVFIGASVGAPLMGWVADRVGPKSVLAWIMVWLAVTSTLAGASISPELLIAFRLLSGLALGAYPPLVITYLTDISPLRRRGGIIFVTCALAYLGPPLVIFGVRLLTPLRPFGVEGWRWPFLVGGLLCLMTGLLFLCAPEAPHWLEATGRPEALSNVAMRFRRSLRFGGQDGGRADADGGALAQTATGSYGAVDLVVGSVTRRARLPGVSLLYFLIPWATVAFPLVTGPTLLARHYSLSDTLLYIGVATFGPVVGTLLAGLVVDRFDRRLFMGACALLMVVAIGLFFGGYGLIATATAMILFGIFSALYLPAMTMFGAELFEPGERGRATTLAWVANRVGATVAPIALVPFVRSHHFGLVGAVMCGALAANIVVLRFLARSGIGSVATEVR